MKLLQGLGTGICFTVLCLLAAPKAQADEWNQRTVITFSAPVEVPGVGQHILPAGTYVFKLVDLPGDRTIVQIFSQDESHVFTTILAISNYRMKPTEKTVMTFSERPAGQPEALKAWFFPDRQWGEEFVYEKSQAIQIAKETNETVLSTPVELASSTTESLKTAPVEAVNPNGEAVEPATIVGARPAATQAPELVASLPKTASDLPLIGLVGLLSLFGGIALFGLAKWHV